MDEKPFSDMIRAKLANSQHSPFCIIPHRGKVAQHNAKSASPQLRGIFNKDRARLDLRNDSAHLAPKSAALSLESFLLAVNVVVCPGWRNVLAWESAADDINLSSPRFSIKGLHIVPDWEFGQDSISLTLQQDLSWVRFNFDSTDCGMSAKDAAEDSSPCSSK